MPAENTPEWISPKGSLLEGVFCQAFLEDHPMVCVNGTLFSPSGMIRDKEPIRKAIYDLIKDYVPGGLAKKSKALLEAVCLECLVDGVIAKHEDRVYAANGTIYLDGSFTEDMQFCRNRLPVAYNPNAPQPENWLRFLSELLQPEDILSLQEYMGYCMIPTTRAQIMMIIKGNGGEGKSRIGVVMHHLLGSNVKNGNLAKVETNAFARADLQHMLAMVDDDMDTTALEHTNYVKSIVTAETPMDLERKKEQSFQGDLYVRFIAFSNGDLQALYDHSDGFFRRQLILTAKKRPKDRADDRHLIERLLPELEGIFLWCLEGLRRLAANGFHFTESDEAKANKEHLKKNANNVLEFLQSEGYIRLKADYCITSKDLYEIYTMWCRDNGYKPVALRTFSGTLCDRQDEFNLEHSNKITNANGKQVNGFWGIQALVKPFAF